MPRSVDKSPGCDEHRPPFAGPELQGRNAVIVQLVRGLVLVDVWVRKVAPLRLAREVPVGHAQQGARAVPSF